MLRSRKEKQQGMEVVILEQMVPENHLLRKIDRSIDFSFINKLCAPLYSENVGRPAVDPEILFRMLFVGYLYGIRSERRLEEEINYNFAYKWFCGLGLTEKAPDATTISVNRTRRFRDNNIAEKIFQEILRQAVEKKLVGGEILYTDSTHVKAKANKHKKTTVTIEKSPKAYMEELDAAIAADRDALGKKPFEKKDDDELPTTQIQQSKNDPESGQLHKEGKPDGFHYSEHRTVDSKNNIVVNVRITPANVNDVDPVTDILDDIEKRLGHLPSYMGVDAGYHNAPTCHQIASRGIQPVVGYGEPYEWLKEVFLDWAFTFMSTYLYYEDRDILDKNGLNLYRKSLACFEGNAPTYHLALREHPVIVWDFHSLMLTVKFMFSVKLTDAKNPMSLCEHCRMAFYAPRADSRFCSAECRKKASKKT